MLEEDKDKNNNSLGFLTNDFKLLETNRFDAQIEIIMQSFSLILALGYALAVNWLITLLFLFGSFVPMFVSNIFQNQFKNLLKSGLRQIVDMLIKQRIFWLVLKL